MFDLCGVFDFVFGIGSFVDNICYMVIDSNGVVFDEVLINFLVFGINDVFEVMFGVLVGLFLFYMENELVVVIDVGIMVMDVDDMFFEGVMVVIISGF